MLQWEHSAILLTFISLPFVFMNFFFFSIFKRQLKTGFTLQNLMNWLVIIFIKTCYGSHWKQLIETLLGVCADPERGTEGPDPPNPPEKSQNVS